MTRSMSTTGEGTITDRIHKSPAGFFHVWLLKHSVAIYNVNGVKVAEFPTISDRTKRMAVLAANALDTEFHL